MTELLTWQCLRFDQLSTTVLHTILKLRCDVFVVEQKCAWPEVDGRDPAALHVCGWTAQGELAAYLRIIAPNTIYPEPSVGRVVSAPAWRRAGAGKQLLTEGLKQLRLHYPDHPVRIGAQSYLTRFYQSFGFEVASEEYIEDDILHVQMLLPAPAPCPLPQEN